MLFHQDDQQREQQQILLKAYEQLRQAGERITVDSLMALVHTQDITQQEVRTFVAKLKRGRAL